ncbi:hypothetical protein PHLGIDRAFT_260657 [Phlebiopsis gigantea 11061_1 CR5-6]|uniref:Uncharacterized protein n=1 Tax=Phlebiopsis gigantea (strain 11061_1 CR5-6) TaxID=745531 RepID=A0A0C3SFQ9_PHLG1|nr:hypothetical protein PHLGIDRAFT_260657 [Phlebiopsis gigantea 11061_1 CR5-6]
MTINTVKQSLRSLHKASLTDDDIEQLARENAALRIQRAWRARKRASYLRTDILWTDLVTHARFKVDRNAAEQGKNTARERWRRSIFLALRLQDGNRMLADRGVHDDKVVGKYLETQHWLELIDGKHRYGANLKVCPYARTTQPHDLSDSTVLP